jgi:hypothetical protein
MPFVAKHYSYFLHIENSQKEGERVKNFLKGNGAKVNDIHTALDMSRQNVGYHFRKDKLDLDFKELLFSHFPILLQMENEDRRSTIVEKDSIKNEEQTPQIPQLKNLDLDDLVELPFISVSARASFIESFLNEAYEEMTTTRVLSNRDLKGYVVIEVSGSSMEHRLRDKDRVLANKSKSG